MEWLEKSLILLNSEPQDTVQVTVDAAQLTDSSSELGVEVLVTADGVEVRPQDNTVSQTLHLEAQASLMIHG